MTKIPQFIEFKDVGGRLGSEFIGVTSNGTLSIYAGFYNKYNVGSFSRCAILVDSVQNLIGIQFGGDDLGEETFKVSIDQGGKTASIYTKNLFKSTGLSILDWYGKYVPEKSSWGDRTNLFVIDLEKKVAINRRARKNKGESAGVSL